MTEEEHVLQWGEKRPLTAAEMNARAEEPKSISKTLNRKQRRDVMKAIAKQGKSNGR